MNTPELGITSKVTTRSAKEKQSIPGASTRNGAAKGKEGDFRVSWGPKGVGAPPPLTAIILSSMFMVQKGQLCKAIEVVSRLAPTSFPILDPSWTPKTDSQNARPGQVNLISQGLRLLFVNLNLLSSGRAHKHLISLHTQIETKTSIKPNIHYYHLGHRAVQDVWHLWATVEEEELSWVTY